MLHIQQGPINLSKFLFFAQQWHSWLYQETTQCSPPDAEYILSCIILYSEVNGIFGPCWFIPSDEETEKYHMPLAQITEAMATCKLPSLFRRGGFGRNDLKCWIQQAERTKHVMVVWMETIQMQGNGLG